MAWVAVDKDGSESIYGNKPYREDIWWIMDNEYDPMVYLPQGTIKKLIGRELTWDDEPVELK